MRKATAKTKATKKPRAKKDPGKCEQKRCRKIKLDGSVFCEKHAEKNDAPERVVKLSETTALTFGKLDAEIRNHMQGIKLAEYEIQAIKRDFQDRINAQKDHQEQLRRSIERIKPLYDELLKDVSSEHDIPQEHLIIDPDSRVIRDSRQDI